MMKTVDRKGRAASLGLVVLLACAAGGICSSRAQSAAPAPQSAFADLNGDPESIVMRWPPRSRNAAGLMLEKYGSPDQYDRDTMAWFNKGEWKRTLVHRRVFRRDPAGKRLDCLEQTVGYLVPKEKVAELKRFSPMIEVSLTAGEMTSASDSEAKNRLALNLAAEIVTGRRGVADARALFLSTSRLAAAGKTSAYLESLLFDADNTLFMAPTGADR